MKYLRKTVIFMVVFFTVLISGCIGTQEDNSNNNFSNEVTVEGETFYLPDGFTLINSEDIGGGIGYEYSDGTDSIVIAKYHYLSKSEVLYNLKSSDAAVILDESAVYTGYSGIVAEINGGESRMFVFDKNGVTFAIEMGNLSIGEYVPKILG